MRLRGSSAGSVPLHAPSAAAAAQVRDCLDSSIKNGKRGSAVCSGVLRENINAVEADRTDGPRIKALFVAGRSLNTLEA
ncbi:hypothetical protein EYF80_033876 [Liparis tanakae]|uniref:Uncharacterized protein n=1 Tax=Liparis tanakae TaxID=230148 RepID=A0A4Z2GQN0_9TELE|nr:hypothetical protein EYF80_033876 [Liparis tanakae]